MTSDLATEIFNFLGGENDPNHGVSFSLTKGNILRDILQTPNLWGHDPAINDYVPTANNLTESIRELLSTAKHTIDIATLHPLPDGRFLDAIRSGINEAHSKGNHLVVRVLQGRVIDVSIDVKDFIKALGLPKEIPIYVGTIHAGLISWNHSKLIIVDGESAIAGGHNLWTAAYCEFAPVHDLSIRLSGPAVATAQAFLNSQWKTIAQKKVSYFSSSLHFNGLSYRNALPVIQSAPATAGITPVDSNVLALGRMGDNIVERSPSANASRTARIEAVKRAKTSIKLSQQKIGKPYDDQFLQAICQQVSNNKQLFIIIGDGDAQNGAGEDYSGDTLEATAKKIGETVSKISGVTGNDLAVMLAQRVHIGPTRMYDKQPGDPARQSWKWRKDSKAIEPANHAKVYIIDEEAFYVGSDNAYALGYVVDWDFNRDGLLEFGFFIASPEYTQKLLNEYWNRFWQYSSQFEFKDWGKLFH